MTEKKRQQSISISPSLYERARLLALVSGNKTVSAFIQDALEAHITTIKASLPPAQLDLLNEVERSFSDQ
jgi:predicted DNA-binding protein